MRRDVLFTPRGSAFIASTTALTHFRSLFRKRPIEYLKLLISLAVLVNATSTNTHPSIDRVFDFDACNIIPLLGRLSHKKALASPLSQ